METEYDGKVLGFWRLPNGIYTVKLKIDDGLGEKKNVKNILPSQLEAFILSNSEAIKNKFIREINEFYKKNIFYTYTASLYIEIKFGIYWLKLILLDIIYAQVKTIMNLEVFLPIVLGF